MAIIPRRLEDDLIKDGFWLRRSLFLPKEEMEKAQVINSNFSDAMTYPFDTTPGGNPAMNPKPQSSPLADIRHSTGANGSQGMGRYYYEAIEQHEVRAYFQPCEPKFNTLTSFLGHFYNPYLGTLVNRGEAPSMFYRIGQGVAFIYTIPLQAFYGLVSMYQRIKAFTTKTPYSKFYYLKPSTRNYWNAVNIMANKIAVDMGIVQGNTSGKKDRSGITDQDINAYRQHLPDILRFGGYGESQDILGIDIYAIATRAQRLANRRYSTLNRIFGKDGQSREAYNNKVRSMIGENSGDNLMEAPSYPDGSGNPSDYKTYLQGFLQEGGSGAEDPNDQRTLAANKAAAEAARRKENGDKNDVSAGLDAPGGLGDQADTVATNFSHWWDNMTEEFRAELSDGAAFICFNIEPFEPTESFTNSTKESSLVSMFDGANNAARDARFSVAEGAIVPGAKEAINKVTDLINGALAQVGLNGLAAAGGSAYVDIPKIYDKSEMDISSTNSFKIVLNTPSRDNMSIFLHQMIPLAMLMPLAVPRSTGKHSYSMPFMVKMFIKGMAKVNIGMVTNLRIARGQGNTKLNANGLSAAMEVTFDVQNMDQMLHMPITDSVFEETFGLFDEDSAYQDYLSVLSGMSLQEQFYLGPRVRLALANWKAINGIRFSSGNIASMLRNTTAGEILSAVAREGDVIGR